MSVVANIGRVVTATKAALSLPVLHYEYGHPTEIVNTLIQMTKTLTHDALKYPLIALFQDFPENEQGAAGSLTKVRLRIVIATRGVTGGKAADRQAQSFDAVLYPIYNEFVHQLTRSPYFLNPARPRHEKIDRPFWGKEGLYGNIANIATDELDCIELRNLELTTLTRDCVPSLGKHF